MENAIEVSHLSFAYTEEAETIKDVSFTIPKGSYTTIIGHNGSGKSTITQFFDKVGEYTNADDVVASTGMDNFEAAKMVDVYSSIKSTSSSITSDMVL